MPSFRTGRVVRIESERPGIQRVGVVLDGDADPSVAVCLTELCGEVALGDEVVCNTTAVELGLGTGGAHFVHWNLARRSLSRASGGHIMKLRYTSLQLDVAAVEEPSSRYHASLADAVVGAGDDVGGMPVVVASLHSLVAAAAGGIAAAQASGTAGAPLHVAYLMTDGAALPLALSDLVAALCEHGFVQSTVTVGHAFGGDVEAVNVPFGIAAARAAGADVVIAAMGPGVVGSGTRFGSTAWEVAGIIESALAVGARPVVALRYSDADLRPRHRGVSHHTLTSLAASGPAGGERRPVGVVVPEVGAEVMAAIMGQLDAAGITPRYDVVSEAPLDAIERLAAAGIALTSMRRGVAEDPVFWAAGAAAGVFAARCATGRCDAG